MLAAGVFGRHPDRNLTALGAGPGFDGSDEEWSLPRAQLSDDL